MARKPKTEDAPEVEETDEVTEKTTKSIVPAKYAGRYKNGGSDALAEFIKAQAGAKEGFSFPAFFDLCRANGLPEDKVAHYEQQVADKRHGAQGRARMTLRNMLATFARKNGSLKALNGEETAISLPKPTLSGAAKAAKEEATAAAF
jgi:hypothetical protein